MNHAQTKKYFSWERVNTLERDYGKSLKYKRQIFKIEILLTQTNGKNTCEDPSSEL